MSKYQVSNGFGSRTGYGLMGYGRFASHNGGNYETKDINEAYQYCMELEGCYSDGPFSVIEIEIEQ